MIRIANSDAVSKGNSLRSEQAAGTWPRIVDAVVALSRERDADVVTSTSAKCSEPTIYRHVPSRAAVFEAANLAREGHE